MPGLIGGPSTEALLDFHLEYLLSAVRSVTHGASGAPRMEQLEADGPPAARVARFRLSFTSIVVIARFSFPWDGHDYVPNVHIEQ